LALPARGELVGPTGGGFGLVGEGEGVVPVVVVGGGPVVVVVALVVVVVVVVVPPEPTTIVPVMKKCASQWNVYVPGVLNVQLPVQPGPVALCGSGGTAPELAPAVWVHELGAAESKSALWKLPPAGYENVTVPPGAILTVLPPPPAVQAKSLAVNEPVLGGSPEAILGSAARLNPASPARTTERSRTRTDV
jgi:hypothetical protein